MPEFQPQPITLLRKDLGLYRLEVPDGMFPVGIHEDVAVFSDQEGHERRYSMPVYDMMSCRVDESVIYSDAAGPIDLYVLVPSNAGEYVTELSIEPGAGAYWIVIALKVRE